LVHRLEAEAELWEQSLGEGLASVRQP